MIKDIINGALLVGLVAILWNATMQGNDASRELARTSPGADTPAFNAEGGATNGGVALPVRWDDLGMQLTETGVIDETKLAALYAARGGLAASDAALLEGPAERITITEENAGYLLNLFWALGLANKNPVLEEGPMAQYGDVAGFASTGGWTLAKGNAMDHYSMHRFIALTPDEQALVERVAKGIYRPCCDNETYFPDCNHGMAMLGFLELAASQGASEAELYRAALVLNEYWFPSNYAALKSYFAKQGVAWDRVDPRIALGKDYSSASGYRNILTQIAPAQPKGGSGCGV